MQNQNRVKQFLARRTQMFVVGLITWILLACWTVSAFWGHVEELGESYQFAAKIGALAAEAIGLGFVFWHCYDKSITVRKWALVFTVILASILVFHAGALRGLKDAKAAQAQVEDRLTEKMTQMSKAQAGSVSARPSLNATQRERLVVAGKNAAAQAEIAKSAQQTVAAEITAGVDKVKDTAIVPRSYLDGWMYAVIFMSAMLMLGILFWQMSNADDIDADYDGVIDREQYPQAQTQQPTMQTPRVQPMQTPQPTMARPQQSIIQRPSFARRVFSGETATPVQSPAPSTPNKPSDDWNNGKGGGSNRSH